MQRKTKMIKAEKERYSAYTTTQLSSKRCHNKIKHRRNSETQYGYTLKWFKFKYIESFIIILKKLLYKHGIEKYRGKNQKKQLSRFRVITLGRERVELGKYCFSFKVYNVMPRQFRWGKELKKESKKKKYMFTHVTQMLLRQLDTTCKRMKLDLFVKPYTEINSKRITDPNVKL